MALSFKIVLFFSILIINIYQSQSYKLHPRASPCCQQSLFTLFSYSPCACPPAVPTTTLPPKPTGIISGAAQLALGTMLNIGGRTFKLIGTLTKNGGELAEVAGYGLKTTGALKFGNGVSNIANFLQKLGNPSSVVCVVEDDKIDFYERVDEKKKDKISKIVKVEKAKDTKLPSVPYKPATTTKTTLTTPIPIIVTTPLVTKKPILTSTTVKPEKTLTYIPKVDYYDNVYLPEEEPLLPEDTPYSGPI